MRAQEKSDVKPNQRTYHEVIAAYARAHEWRLAERTFEEMKRDPNVGWHETLDKIAAEYENKTNKDDDDREDDEDSYNNSRYSRSGGGGRYGGGGYGERRPFVARDRKGPSNDSVRVYTSLISAYGKGGQWEKALAAFQELENTPGCFCDTGSHNALLSAAVSAAKYPEAAQLFTSMAKNPRVRRNVTTYNSLSTGTIPLLVIKTVNARWIYSLDAREIQSYGVPRLFLTPLSARARNNPTTNLSIWF